MESPSGFAVSILFLVSILRGALIGQFPTRRGQYHTEQRRFVNFKKSASLILSIFIVKKQNMIDLFTGYEDDSKFIIPWITSEVLRDC